MHKFNFSKFTNSVRTTISKHSPEILLGIGIAGMMTAGILAVKETPKALRLIEEAKAEAQVDKLTPVEIVKATWKCYVPATVTAGLSVACLIGSSRVNSRRNAALATAYKISEAALTEYREKVVETIGEKKEQSIRDAVAKDRVEQNPASTREIVITEKGNTMCYDMWTDRYFKSDIDAIKKAENELNRRMRYENYVSLNEFYNEIGLKSTKEGSHIGWNIDRGYIDILFSACLDDNGNPCLAIDFRVAPQYDFDKLA